jgi:ketosteroid isomerase-like protein
LAAREVIERLRDAQNRHDLEAFLACFDPDYRSEQPAHPARAFGGREQVRENWSKIFSSVPDFRADLLASAEDGDAAWAEWRWTGRRADGTPLHMRGVTILGVRGDRIVSGRLYMEPVEEAGPGVGGAVRRMTHGSGGPS